MNITGNLKQIYLYLKYVFVSYHLFYFIVHVMLCVTEMKTCFIFFIINIISVQVNQSALLNGIKITSMWVVCFVLQWDVFANVCSNFCSYFFTQHFNLAADFLPASLTIIAMFLWHDSIPHQSMIRPQKDGDITLCDFPYMCQGAKEVRCLLWLRKTDLHKSESMRGKQSCQTREASTHQHRTSYSYSCF